MFDRIFILENKKIKGIEKEKKKLEKLLKSCGKIVEKKIENSDLILTMGGDGTILKAISFLKEKEIPIYGINYGKVGFLTNSSEKIEKKLKKIFKGDYRLEERLLLEISIKKSRENIYKDICLNEFLIFRKGIRIVEIKVKIDGNEIYNLRADGIIISTPTGSTSHSFSAGGPIIEPLIESILIIPISPYTLSWKPIILSSDKKIKLNIIPDGKVISDGQREFDVNKDNIIEINKSKKKAKIIIEDDFFDKLKTKFNFGK